jgi:hypothetical protein
MVPLASYERPKDQVLRNRGEGDEDNMAEWWPRGAEKREAGFQREGRGMFRKGNDRQCQILLITRLKDPLD